MLLAAATFAALPAVAQVAPLSEQRLALVVGNGAYPGQALKNAPNDARALAASLRKLGFTVIERIDAGKKAMEDAVLEFGEKLRAGGVGLFYYAGHGLQVRGRNYLVPIDASLPSEASVRVQAVDVDLVLEQLNEARNRANVVILDACRNNPFLPRMRGAPTGLAAIDAARGTLIAYSTAPGKVAADGDGRNSPYTAALVRALDEPGLKAEDVFKRVRRQVVDTTRGTQTPWESSSLTGDLIINLNVTIEPPAPVPAAQATVPGRDPADVAFWTSIQASTDPQDYQDYLAQFPKGTFVTLAKRRLNEINRKLQATAEEERKRLAREEVERKQKEADELERMQEMARRAEEQRRQQQALAPAPSVVARPVDAEQIRNTLYRSFTSSGAMSVTAISGAREGQPRDYREVKGHKVMVACIDWTRTTDTMLVHQGRTATWEHDDHSDAKSQALGWCEENRTSGTWRNCACQVVDDNDTNALVLADEFLKRLARP